MAWDPLASVGRVLTIVGSVRGGNCTDVHLARLIAGVQKAGLDVHDISLARGSAYVLGYEVTPANAYCSGTDKRISLFRSVARTISSRRRIGGRAMVLVNDHESFLALSNRGALSILDASSKFTRASDLVPGESWSVVRFEQKAYGRILCLLRSDRSLRWLDVCICTDAIEKGFVFAVREGCRMLASEVGGVSERRRLKRSSRSIRARSRARRSTSHKSVWSVQARTRMRCRLPKESCADFSEVSLQLPASSAWWHAVGFSRDEHIIVLETRSTPHAVRSGESCCPPGRLLVLSENLALVLALCKGRSDDVPLLSVMRRIFASGFRAGFVLPFRWIRSELNYSDEGSRFFDCDHDPSESLLQVLAQRLPRFSPARTCDQDCLSRILARNLQSDARRQEKFDEFQESREAGTSGCASSRPARWQRRRTAKPAAKKRAISCAEVRTGGFWTTTPPLAHAGRSFDVSRWKFGRIDEAKGCEHPHHGGVVEPYLAGSSSV